MRTKTVTLDPEVLDVLRRSTLDERSVRLPEQLERALYERVAKALTAAGGKWNRKAGCHLFDVDPRQTLTLDAGAVVHRQQTLQAFDTPDPVCDQIVAFAAAGRGAMCLEPSAGTGAIVRAMLRAGVRAADILAVEIDEIRARGLDQTIDAGVRVIQGDFLQWPSEIHFDAIVMNPPFHGGDDVRHVEHAFSMLAPGGRLVAIIAPASLTKCTRPFVDLQRLVKIHGTLVEQLPRGTFADTDIATSIIRLERRSR